MRERPILFSGPMVRAILSGTKTKTRRPMRLDPDAWTFLRMQDGYRDGDLRAVFEHDSGDVVVGIRAPSAPGDRLWVRETWAACQLVRDIADEGQSVSVEPGRHDHLAYRADDGDDIVGPWRPSIHMPRWASRIALEVTGVHVERLQGITEDDARAEGVVQTEAGGYVVRGAAHDSPTMHIADPRLAFTLAWDETYGGTASAWNANPRVWVVSFRRVSP